MGNNSLNWRISKISEVNAWSMHLVNAQGFNSLNWRINPILEGGPLHEEGEYPHTPIPLLGNITLLQGTQPLSLAYVPPLIGYIYVCMFVSRKMPYSHPSNTLLRRKHPTYNDWVYDSYKGLGYKTCCWLNFRHFSNKRLWF